MKTIYSKILLLSLIALLTGCLSVKENTLDCGFKGLLMTFDQADLLPYYDLSKEKTDACYKICTILDGNIREFNLTIPKSRGTELVVCTRNFKEILFLNRFFYEGRFLENCQLFQYKNLFICKSLDVLYLFDDQYISSFLERQRLRFKDEDMFDLLKYAYVINKQYFESLCRQLGDHAIAPLKLANEYESLAAEEGFEGRKNLYFEFQIIYMALFEHALLESATRGNIDYKRYFKGFQQNQIAVLSLSEIAYTEINDYEQFERESLQIIEDQNESDPIDRIRLKLILKDINSNYLPQTNTYVVPFKGKIMFMTNFSLAHEFKDFVVSAVRHNSIKLNQQWGTPFIQTSKLKSYVNNYPIIQHIFFSAPTAGRHQKAFVAGKFGEAFILSFMEKKDEKWEVIKFYNKDLLNRFDDF